MLVNIRQGDLNRSKLGHTKQITDQFLGKANAACANDCDLE
jgi:hypothetical protein